LHNMFLMHDDIEDGDTMRRDKPTVWVKFGTANAINAGDYLLGRAYRVLLDSDLPLEKKIRLLDIFTFAYERTVEGQALDINWRGSEDFTIDHYLETVELKTAYYLTCGMAGGAVVAGRSDAVIEKIWELGKSMGPAFQIRDDLIDLTQGKGRGRSHRVGYKGRKAQLSLRLHHEPGRRGGQGKAYRDNAQAP
ncbi:MAG: polyprenyl synthetase family protein, partial [Candidatus Bathyanammoxibius sp.]